MNRRTFDGYLPTFPSMVCRMPSSTFTTKPMWPCQLPRLPLSQQTTSPASGWSTKLPASPIRRHSTLATPERLKGITFFISAHAFSKHQLTNAAHQAPSLSSSPSYSLPCSISTNGPELLPPSSPRPILAAATASAAPPSGLAAGLSPANAASSDACVFGPHIPSISRSWSSCQLATSCTTCRSLKRPFSYWSSLYFSALCRVS